MFNYGVLDFVAWNVYLKSSILECLFDGCMCVLRGGWNRLLCMSLPTSLS